MLFEWDENKNRRNILKHGVSFEEAKLIFDQPALTYFDVENSGSEDRYLDIGFVNGRLLAVIFVQINSDVIRIISARKASLTEGKLYERGY